MYIDTNTIISIASLSGAIVAIFGLIFTVYKWFLKQEQQDKDIANIKEEQTLICYGMLACLEGLKQLNCNGPVTDARDRLEKHLNESAHK
ncbi:branched-chain amino acid ABC transporter permease [Konateibacter massiliensis]|uniref:branched-chain amino acid ABC transporter permease n=1 Tax=Konateibacter massiliensis TaxID=2002841 RepID=UPI000C15CDE5|nr:branched-chain amino acid ABC transporter permease [Konateibacter massiliensis]